ncbi:MAG: RDD family protein [Chloroflexota bacterium]
MNEKIYDTVSYELADTGTRFIALVIDGLILALITGALTVATRGAGGLSFIVGLGYYWYFWTRNAGQSPGKMAMNIRVVKVDGTPINDMDAFLRYIGYSINSVVFCLGWFWALFDENHQGWHDKIAKTYVVKAEKRKNLDL